MEVNYNYHIQIKRTKLVHRQKKQHYHSLNLITFLATLQFKISRIVIVKMIIWNINRIVIIYLFVYDFKAYEL